MRNVKTVALACLLLVALGVASAFAQSIEGLWKIIDDKTNSPTAIVMLYTNGGKLYGRMMATIDKNTGAIKDTIAVRKDKADALAGDPPFCGLDFVYELQAKGKDWKARSSTPKTAKYMTAPSSRTAQSSSCAARSRARAACSGGIRPGSVPAPPTCLPASYCLIPQVSCPLFLRRNKAAGLKARRGLGYGGLSPHYGEVVVAGCQRGL